LIKEGEAVAKEESNIFDERIENFDISD